MVGNAWECCFMCFYVVGAFFSHVFLHFFMNLGTQTTSKKRPENALFKAVKDPQFKKIRRSSPLKCCSALRRFFQILIAQCRSKLFEVRGLLPSERINFSFTNARKSQICAAFWGSRSSSSPSSSSPSSAEVNIPRTSPEKKLLKN